MKNIYKMVVLFIIVCLFNCSHTLFIQTTQIRIKGSDTMLILTQRWAEEYMKLRPHVSVYAESGGTENGIKALIAGTVQICAASRPLRPEEARLLAEKFNRLGMSFLVAKDAISIYIHPDNPVDTIELKKLKQIFTGEIDNWKEVGGTDEKIKLLSRSPNSGTYLYFKEHVLNDAPYSSAAVATPSTYTIVDAVLKSRNAIGYGGVAYGPDIKLCPINGIAPTEENVRNDTYPIIRYLYLYTIDTPQGEIKSFIDWILKDGQKIVKEVGYIPLWGDK